MAKIPNVADLGARPQISVATGAGGGAPDTRGTERVLGALQNDAEKSASLVAASGRLANQRGEAAVDKAIGAGRVGEQIGDTTQHAVGVIEQAMGRVQAREDAVALATSISGYQTKGDEALSKYQTEGDPTDPETSQKFVDGMATTAKDTLSNFKGSADAYARLAAEVENNRADYVQKAAAYKVEAGKAKLAELINSTGKELAHDTYNNPTNLAKNYAAADSRLQLVSSGLSQAEQIKAGAELKNAITVSAIQSLLERGSLDAAQTLITQNPTVMRNLTPEQYININRQITSQVKDNSAQYVKQTGYALVLGNVLGQAPTMAQAARFAAYQATSPGNSPAALQRGVEIATGGQLTSDQLQRVNGGSGSLSMETQPGKLIEDRKKLIAAYGEGSQEVTEFDQKASQAGMGGARPEIITNRILMSARTAISDLHNITLLPSGARSSFWGDDPGHSLFDVSRKLLEKEVSTQDVQTYDAASAGIERSLANIEGFGSIPNNAFSGQMARYALKEGDTELTKLYKLASVRQVTENGLATLLDSKFIGAQQKASAQALLDHLKEVIPFEPSDIIKLSTSSGGKTLNDLIKDKGLGVSSQLSGKGGSGTYEKGRIYQSGGKYREWDGSGWQEPDPGRLARILAGRSVDK